MVNLIKRFLVTLIRQAARLAAATLIIFGMSIILLGLASAIGIIVIVACPFVALAQGVYFWEASKRGVL